METTSQNPSLSRASLIDPESLMSIRNLELRARVVVEGFWTGIHRSPYHGFSAEFTEYRQYSPDDDLRYLDWRVFARSDRYFIKKFEEETNLRCYLVVDQSLSMNYASRKMTKAEYAATLAATLAYFLHLQGDGIGLLTFEEKIRDYLPARHRTGHLRQLMHLLERPPTGTATHLSEPLKRIVEVVRKRGLLVLISDFLAPLDKLESDLLALAAAGHEVVVFQVLDPAELQFNFDRAAMFEDAETGKTLFIDPSRARADYLHQLEAHCAGLRSTCQKLGASCHRLDTARPLELALYDFLRSRSRRRTGARKLNRAAGGGTK